MAKLGLKQGEKLSLQKRLEVICSIADDIDQGVTSVASIVDKFGVARTTAVEWRDAAMALRAAETKGFTREGYRNLITGQYLGLLERLNAIQAENTDDRVKVAGRIADTLDKLARIQGLHTVIVENTHEIKPLNIIRAQTTPEQIIPIPSHKPSTDE